MTKGWLEHLGKLTPDALLDGMRAGSAEVYLLGSLHRHVTFYTQQTRALNLIQALRGRLNGARLAVIGAGFSGLTAAAFAAQETSAEVVVVERGLRPLWIQDQSSKRWVHPRIYDWPNPGALEPRTDLPVLNWRAGSARSIAASVRAQWDDLIAANDRLSEHYGWRVIRYEAAGKKLKLQLESEPPRTGPIPGALSGEFDFVILAVGFGLERASIGEPALCPSYWNDVDGIDQLEKGTQIAIVGVGDGGLTDVLRLSIREFDQGRLVQLLDGFDVSQFEYLRTWEREYHTNPEELSKRYEEDPAAIDQVLLERLKLHLRTDHRITVISNEPPYGPGAAILNRFLVRHLQALGAFQLVRGKVRDAKRVENERVKVIYAFADAAEQTLEVDHAILRFGPSPVWRKAVADDAVTRFDATEKHWRETSQDADRTRVPLVASTSPACAPPAALASLPARESGSDRWLLILHPPKTGSRWAELAPELRKQMIGSHGWSTATTEPLVLALDQIVAQDSYTAAVQALCSAPAALFDLEGRHPLIMLLLGIRAVVRRGLTIVCDRHDGSATYWTSLPFNIRDLNPLSTTDPKIISTLARIFADGLKLSEERPNYLDLPAFDGVRALGIVPRDYEPIPQSSSVLFLCPFDPTYKKTGLEFLKDALRTRLPQAQLNTVIDQESARLANHRLYEAIRLTRLCVVDLTGWRPNVLFEVGVRLASNPVRPLVFRNRDDDVSSNDKDAAEFLTKLLGAVRYKVPGANTDVTNAYDDWQKKNDERTTFSITSHYFEVEHERDTRPLANNLEQSAALSLRTDAPLEKVDPTHLFASGNDRLARVVRRRGLEQMAAAWSHLDQWEAPYAREIAALFDPKFRSTFRQYARLRSGLEAILENFSSPEATRMKELLEQRQTDPRFVALARFDRLLTTWELDRNLLSTLASKPESSAEDNATLVSDLENLEHQRQQLNKEMRAVGGSAAELPLQGLEVDGVIIARWMKKLAT